MGRTEVTVSAYGSFSKLPEGNGISILPVVDVTWDERNPSVSGMRLPTEAEWEYAARAGTTGPRYGALDEIAWHAGNSRRKLHPVGEKQPNQWGLYDMLGNAKEWVADPVGAYQQASAIDPTGPSSDHPFGVVRGGAWSDEPKDVRASWRDIVPDSTGFRCAGELR